MSIAENRWFEVWFTDGEDVEPTYLLIVKPDQANPEFVVVLDPIENFKVIYKGKIYEETKLWLQEDEYELVEGRVFPDDGW